MNLQRPVWAARIAVVTTPPDVLQVRRAARALLRQRGGSLLMRLHGCGAEVRLECTLLPSSALMVARSSTVAGAEVLVRATEGVRAECQRAGCRLERLDSSAPELTGALNLAA